MFYLANAQQSNKEYTCREIARHKEINIPKRKRKWTSTKSTSSTARKDEESTEESYMHGSCTEKFSKITQHDVQITWTNYANCTANQRQQIIKLKRHSPIKIPKFQANQQRSLFYSLNTRVHSSIVYYFTHSSIYFNIFPSLISYH